MVDKTNKKSGYEELSQLYLFDDLYQFFRQSTGLAITIVYLLLILSSMAYLYIFFDAFDINILQFVSFEDILGTPIKNPDIILVFLLILLVFYLIDISNRFRAKLNLKYEDDRKPFFVKVINHIFWAPLKKKNNINLAIGTLLLILVIYTLGFAKLESEDIKEGKGNVVEITLSDENATVQTTMLGSSINYVFTYDHVKQKSIVYSIESIKSIKKMSLKEQNTKAQSTITTPQVIKDDTTKQKE